MTGIKKDTLIVSEIFYSIQGEGNYTGVPSIFLRLAGCNLFCGGTDGQGAWVCDTIEVWKKGKSMTYEEISVKIIKLLSICESTGNINLVITGGEPLLQQDSLINFLNFSVTYLFNRIEIETNGTILPKQSLTALVNQYNVSLKIGSSIAGSIEERINPEAITYFSQLPKHLMLDITFKFVVFNDVDVEEIKEIGELYKIHNSRITLMPAGDSIESLYLTRHIVAHHCKINGWRMSDRMHITIWNKKTGV
jgi:7-carboxy-7-deazaguanine synthase